MQISGLSTLDFGVSVALLSLPFAVEDGEEAEEGYAGYDDADRDDCYEDGARDDHLVLGYLGAVG